MNIFREYIWTEGKVSMPVENVSEEDDGYIIRKAYVLHSEHSGLGKIFLIPREQLMPLFCHEQGKQIHAISLDVDSVDRPSNLLDLDRTFKTNDEEVDFLYDHNVSAAEALLSGLSVLARRSNLLSARKTLQIQVGFTVRTKLLGDAQLLDKTVVSGEYHELILNTCKDFLQEMTSQIAQKTCNIF